MPKRSKKPHEMTTEEALKHLFPKPAADHLKKVAKEATEKGEKPNESATKEDSN